MRYLIPVALIVAAAGPWLNNAVAQNAPATQAQAGASEPAFTPLTTPWTFPDRDAVNAGTVTIITAPAGGAKSVFAADMARVLDEKDKLRILPVLGKGPVQNVIDVLYLKSIDMGLVATDVPEFYKIQYGSNITERLRYIMKLYNDEIHIIAPTEIKTVFDLEGKRIEAPKDVGLYSAKAIFSRLKINVTYDSTHLNDDTGALQEVIDGKADAWIVGTAKVMPIARNLKNENRRLHLVSIPYDPRLQDLYLPSEFTSDDYPNLIAPGERIDTVAAGILLVAFNWPENTDRYQRVARFVDALFSRIDEFSKPPRHPKWKEASVAAVVPGWQRFKAAQDWIDRWRAQHVDAASQASLATFKDFLASQGRSNLSPQELERLYAQFLDWNRRAKN
ncbi:MAG TPA: hypothetical protein VEJ37_08960 [Xanthobacteraceae bacterium]|nr:hypothetical protein [Xanthobacteraceae bacterium]